MSGQSWVLAYEIDADRTCVPVGSQVVEGKPVVVGRHGEVPLGVEVYDRGISREAAVITATAHGWDVRISNTNGAVIHPWGQAPILASERNFLTWPLVGVRFLNGSDRRGEENRQHWVLLESETITVTRSGARPAGPGLTTTSKGDRPRPLSTAQDEALRMVFAPQLAWPPIQPAVPLQLKQVARALGITEGAVQQRLSPAQERALRLGLHREVHLTDPEYLYLLIRAGYIDPPASRPYRSELR
jgi:hypothetical protein